jgi:hypothetical protein
VHLRARCSSDARPAALRYRAAVLRRRVSILRRITMSQLSTSRVATGGHELEANCGYKQACACASRIVVALRACAAPLPDGRTRGGELASGETRFNKNIPCSHGRQDKASSDTKMLDSCNHRPAYHRRADCLNHTDMGQAGSPLTSSRFSSSFSSAVSVTYAINPRMR